MIIDLLQNYGGAIRSALIALPIMGTIAVFAYVYYRFHRDHFNEWLVVRYLRLFRRPYLLLPYYGGSNEHIDDGPIVRYFLLIPNNYKSVTRRYRAELHPSVKDWAIQTQTRIRLPIRFTDGSQVRVLIFDSEPEKLAFLLRWRGEGQAITPWP